MKTFRFITKCICFFLIFAILFVVIQENLRDKWAEGEYDVSVKVDGFYAEEPDTLDVVFVGSSQMYADMAPAVLFDRFGITSYDFCANEQPLWVSYYYIKEAIKRQHPKVIVLDVFTVYGDDYEQEGVMHINLDDLPMSFNKLCAIRDGVPKDLRYSFYFPIAKYHNTWTDLYENKVAMSFYHEKDPNKGYSPFIFAGDYEEGAKQEVVEQTKKEPLPDRAKEWLLKIIELCSDEQVELVLTKTPNGNADRQKLYNSVEELAAQQGVRFFNMNTRLDGQAHINIIQAEKVSVMMGEYLCDQFSFEDKRQDPAYASWYDSVSLFNRQKSKCEIISADSYEEYLPLLAREGYDVFITYKNETDQELTKEEIAFFNQTFGTTFDPAGDTAYCAVIEDGKMVLQSADPNKIPETDEAVVTNESVAANGAVEKADGSVTMKLTMSDNLQKNLDVVLQSDGNKTDGSAAILVNGTDFSMNCDGFNIAIYDKYLGEMVEMSAFDLNDNMKLYRK